MVNVLEVRLMGENNCKQKTSFLKKMGRQIK